MYVPGCPSQGLTSTHKHHSRLTSYPRHARIIAKASSQHQQQHQPQPEQAVPVQPPKQQTGDDPRLKWARPEWVKPTAQPTKPNSSSSLVAAAGLRPGSNTQLSAAALQRRQRLLNKVTYGSLNSSNDSSDNFAESSSRWKQHEQFFQAMGVDFGLRRVGIAVRRSSHNVPLLTLHRQQDTGSSSDSSSSNSKSQGKQKRQQQQGVPGHQQNSRSSARSRSLLPLRQTAAVVLHLAVQEGCDGFVIGLPVYAAPAAATGTAAAAALGQRSWISVIRGFAQTLADLAAPLELPVLLVNEQESSQQARAVMAGAAAYDVKSQAELDAEHAAAVRAEQQPQQRVTKQQWHELRKQQHALGREAFAAALILSRYYNGLVDPVEQLQARSKNSSSRSSRRSDDGSSGSASSSQQGGWASRDVQQQAAADLQWMLLSPLEQRRRRKQREQMKAAAAAAAGAAAPLHGGPEVEP